MLLIDEAARKCGITPEFLIIGSSGPCDYPPSTERFNYEFIEFNEKALLKNPHGLYRAIASCDAIFDIGEGDSFSDIYGAKRLINLGVGALSISNMLLIDEAARKCGITPEFLIIGS
ncbi:hypothetical protein, partial [Acinetobacter baumannii]|uniref:hypothetical protein n=1 Tax=Acinetobacter baumannii TaxID=470 RepID=UPI001D17555D